MPSGSSWRDRLQRLRREAQTAAEQAAIAAREAAERARPVVEEQAARGRAFVEQKQSERRAAQEARERWYLTEPGPVATIGYPDEAAMRRGITAAAEHGWRMEAIRNVPQQRGPSIGGGLAGLAARQAMQRFRRPDRFLVTFRRDTSPPAADAEAPVSDAPAP